MILPRKVAQAVELFIMTSKGHNCVEIAQCTNLSKYEVLTSIRILRKAGIVTLAHGSRGGVRRAWNAPKDKDALPSLLGYSSTPYFWNAVRKFKIKTFPKMLNILPTKKSDKVGPELVQNVRMAKCGHPSAKRYYKCEKCLPDFKLKPEDAYESY